MPKMFQHDCSKCRFIDHLCGHDVYVCETCVAGPSIIARYGVDERYASTPIKHFQRQIKENGLIAIGDKNMPFQDYLFSEHVSSYHKAWMLGLLHDWF